MSGEELFIAGTLVGLAADLPGIYKDLKGQDHTPEEKRMAVMVRILIVFLVLLYAYTHRKGKG